MIYYFRGQDISYKMKDETIMSGISNFEVVDEFSSYDRKAIDDGLATHTITEKAPELVYQGLAVLLRNNQGELNAGLYGKTFWDWLEIEGFWVHPDLRGQGIGRKLLKAAEAEACKRECVGVYLWTQSFDAPDFYEKAGYERFAKMPDFPRGHSRVGFRKKLVPWNGLRSG